MELHSYILDLDVRHKCINAPHDLPAIFPLASVKQLMLRMHEQ